MWANNPILRAVADPIAKIDKDIIQLARDMQVVCREYDGVGLAAPQIGVPLRIIYTTQWKETPKWLKYLRDQIMINPVVLSQTKKMDTDIEWCLSLPGVEWNVERYSWVKVQYEDISWKTIVQSYKWFDARIIQHEIDHINGILFIDKAVKTWKVKG